MTIELRLNAGLDQGESGLDIATLIQWALFGIGVRDATGQADRKRKEELAEWFLSDPDAGRTAVVGEDLTRKEATLLCEVLYERLGEDGLKMLMHPENI